MKETIPQEQYSSEDIFDGEKQQINKISFLMRDRKQLKILPLLLKILNWIYQLFFSILTNNINQILQKNKQIQRNFFSFLKQLSKTISLSPFMYPLHKISQIQKKHTEIIPPQQVSETEKSFEQLYVEIINTYDITNVEEFDYQGINWKEIRVQSRKQYRKIRKQQYDPRREFPAKKFPTYPSKPRVADNSFYTIDKYFKGLKPQCTHQQLMNCVQAVSNHDIYFTSKGYLNHVSIKRNTVRKLIPQRTIDFVPSCFSVNKECFVLGGLNGQLYFEDMITKKCQYLRNATQCFTEPLGDIINQVQIFQDGSSRELLTSQNDKYIQIFDLENILSKPKFRMNCPTQVNVAKYNPLNQNTIAVWCDSTEAYIMDARLKSITLTLEGHEDFGLQLDWHPKGIQLATGNQDGTTRIWDIRNTKKSLHILPSEMGNSYNVQFSPSGQYLAVLECADFLNIYNVNTDYSERQMIDYFGGGTGISFFDDSLFFGADVGEYNGIFKLHKTKGNARYQNEMAEYSI